MTAAASAAPSRRRRWGLLAAIAIVGVALAGGAVYLATRPGESPTAPIAAADPTKPAGADTSTQPDPKAAGSAADPRTAGTVVDPKPTDPKPTDPKPGKPTRPDRRGNTDLKPAGRDSRLPTPVIDNEGEDGDDDIRQKLKQAAAALDRREYELAERLATAVIHSPAGPRQHANARLIHGTVQCVHRNDVEAAGIDLRSLDGFRVLQARLRAVCKSRGVLADP